MKTKVVIILIFVVIGLIGTILFLSNQLSKTKKDRDRIESNYFNANQELDSVRDKNGTLHYTVETLNLTKKEMEVTHSDLIDKIDNMGLKIKRLESAASTNIKYEVKDSLIPTKIVNDTTFISERKDDWTSTSWKSTLTCNGSKLKVTDYSMQLKDSIITATEFTTNGWWIFKKVTGVKLHTKTLNPYSKVEKIEYIRLHK